MGNAPDARLRLVDRFDQDCATVVSPTATARRGSAGKRSRQD
ncbi:MAG: hypothetical protein NTX53_21135 [candidate division WOR-3 bacterium]|nr:hypothetical protein [candidate division WOR-3 bacterium]